MIFRGESVKWPVVLGHAIHAIVLLLPTLLFCGRNGFDFAICLFALGVVLSACVESNSVAPYFEPCGGQVCDSLALWVCAATGAGILLMLWVAQIEHAFVRHPSVLEIAVGAALLILGTTMRIVAIRTLKQSFVSDIRVNRQRVRHGIYAWMKHPSEIGTVFFVIGATLLIGATRSTLAAASILIPIAIWRMWREDVAWSGVPR